MESSKSHGSMASQVFRYNSATLMSIATQHSIPLQYSVPLHVRMSDDIVEEIAGQPETNEGVLNTISSCLSIDLVCFIYILLNFEKLVVKYNEQDS